MVRDKYNFILNLIKNKKLNTSQKERVLKLTVLEAQKEGEKNNDREISKHKIIRNPKHVADFMNLFNKRDGLKYLTHDFDESSDFDIEKFLGEAKELFQKKARKELQIPQSLYAIVEAFAFENKEWTSTSEDYKTKITHTTGWASQEWRNWSNENKLHPIHNLDFEKIISDFKRITRIERNNLPKLLKTCIDEVFGSEKEKFEFQIEDTEKADFYSHVDSLKEAIITVFEEVKKRGNTTDKKKISVRYQRVTIDSYYLRKLIITHHNSFPEKELKILVSEWKEKGNMGKILTKLNGYCHWSVETIIENTPKKINILKEENAPEDETIKSNPEGFTHVFTFYYK
jgi:hypothetical protein